MAIFKGRVRVRYGYSRWGYTRNNGKGWHGGSDEEGLDSTTIRMPGPDAGRGELPVFLPQRAESGIRGPAGEKR